MEPQDPPFVEVNAPIRLKPIVVPNFILQAAGNAPSISVRDLPEAALAQLADTFRADLFAQAGKQDPAKPHRR